MTSGVLPNPSSNLQVQTGSGMNVIINPGFAICNGCLKLEETQRTMAVQASSDTYDRIDTVVLRLNDNDSVRECDFYVLHGVPATSPVRPELTQTDSIWEIGLADLFISKNSTVISADKITDTRYETARCGIISAIAEFDTTTIYNQIQADLAEFKEEEQADILAWFEDIKGQLSGDVAVNLQNQIGALSLLDTDTKSDLVSAINEVNSKEVTVLDSAEEIEANTDGRKVAGALGVKEMYTKVNDSLKADNGQGFQFAYDSASGKYGYKVKEADSEEFVPFSSKLINLGSASSYDLKSYANYKSFTNDNFLMAVNSYSNGGSGASYGDSIKHDVVISKSYNASTGILSCSAYIRAYRVHSSGQAGLFGADIPYTVYLVP